LGFGVEGLGYKVKSLGFRDQGLGFGVFRFRVWVHLEAVEVGSGVDGVHRFARRLFRGKVDDAAALGRASLVRRRAEHLQGWSLGFRV